MAIHAPTTLEETLSDLTNQLGGLREAVLREGAARLAELDRRTGRAEASVVNLAHYLALRSHDLRPLQRRLMQHGLSSLGRLEGRVLPSLDAVLRAAEALAGREPSVAAPDETAFFAGEAELRMATDALFGSSPAHRQGRVMMTLPAEAAGDSRLVLRYARAGMDIARINCAHDAAGAWAAMARNVRSAGRKIGREIRIHMDIAGPKIRTDATASLEKKDRIDAGGILRLVAASEPRVDQEAPFSATLSLPSLVGRLRIGDRFAYDDGKLAGEVVALRVGEALVKIARAKTGGVKLKPEKGVNLPDTALGLSPLTAKDRVDLDAVIGLADIIGYSFVRCADDIDLLEAALAGRNRSARPLGLIAKIERPEAVRNLPSLIARAAGRRPFGVMIARGDLAAEIGFERLAEMQEEILWICEAGRVPAVWATQVLEGLVKEGAPSRGEMTDAAMATRAECVMLNKGPNAEAAIMLLGRLLERMDGHLHKKTPTLRELHAFNSRPESAAIAPVAGPRGA